ncbi:serine hydrolase domain-containing protein [Nocardia sp. NPDC051832]|uniref:serine hydrolase domain-containing protein n=1 Tax=Nocardia sp. NPDC051832 TaxID=3155673 RepID=UPI00341E6295
MRLRAFTIPICAAAVLLSACSTSAVEPAASTGASAPTQALAAPMESLRGDLDTMVRAGAVGAIATLTGNGVTAVATAGHADIATGTTIPVDRPQYVRVGSVTKTFTAAILLQLAAEHRVDLDQPIDTYLPGLLRGDGVDGRAITVRQILGHRSGLPEPAPTPELNEYAAARDGRTFTPAQEIAIALELPAQFTPGARFHYNNINYIVAGMLIEAVTGHRYADELRDRILTPLNMSNTYLPATAETGLRQPHPTGYATLDGAVTDVTPMEPSLPWASGAMISTGADLNRFYTALLAGAVVPPTELGQMLAGSDMGNGDGMSYGLGLGYTQLPCGTEYVGNVGGVLGFTAITGATTAGRAVTVSYTGTPTAVDIGAILTHALCG